MKKTYLKSLLATLLLLCSTIATAHAFEVDGIIYYKFTSSTAKTVEVASSRYYSSSVSIPSSVTYDGTIYSVTSIGELAFSGCSGLTSITIPNSVTSIGKDAFKNCSDLTSVTIGSGVTSIGEGAFYNCYNLKEVHITDIAAWCNIDFDNYSANPLHNDELLNTNRKKVTNLYLNGKKVTNLVIPNGVTEIKQNAFIGCIGLASVTIPNSVTSIDICAFDCCSGLTSVTIGSGVTSINPCAFRFCYGLKSVVIPNSVTSIGYSAFGSCSSLTSVTIGSGVTSIGDGAFGSCSSLASVTIPNDVTSIGNYAFNGCSGLKSVTIGSDVTSIGNYAFSGCSGLKSVTIPNDVTSIGNYAFNGCSGLKVVYNNSSLNIVKGSSDNGYVAYYANAVIVPGNNTFQTVGDYVFTTTDSVNTLVAYIGGGGDITLLTNYNGENYKIGYSAFEGCTGLTNVTIPESVTRIGDNAFLGCSSLKSVVIPNSVTSIGYYAFRDCSGLKSVTIGSGVTSIGYSAFLGCSGLKVVYNNSSLNIVKGSSDNGYVAYYANAVIVPGDGTYQFVGDYVFTTTDSVNTLVAYIGLGGDIALPADYNGESYKIGEKVFYYSDGLTSVIIPENVTSIGSSAFEFCNSLKEVHITDIVAWCNIDFDNYSANPLHYANNLYLNGEKITNLVIPEGVTEIKKNAFYNCSGLTSITIPNSVTSIGETAFYNCSGLKEVHITDLTAWCNIDFDNYSANPLHYANNLYLNGEKITNLVIPEGITSIGAYAFSNCTGLTNVTIPESVTSIGPGAFRYCTGLTSITIPESVTSIGSYAFSNCTGLTSITIPESVTSIGSYAFNYCSGLTSVTIPEGVTSIEIGALSGCTGLTSITIPNSVTSIGEDAFSNCTGLTNVTIPESVTSIGPGAFYDCTGLKTIINLSNLTFTKGSSNYGYVAYYADKVINAPNGSVEGDFIFDENYILVAYAGNDSEVILPANYKGGSYSIGNNAFRGNTTMESVTIPASVTSIGECAFSGCSNLTSIYAESSLPSWLASDAFAEHYNSATLYVPAGTKEAYTATTSQREDCEVTVPTTHCNDLQGAMKSYKSGTGVTYTTVNVATQNPDVTGILYGSDYLLAYTNEKNASKLPSATFGITGTSTGRYKIALVTAPWFIESYEDTLVTSTTAPKYRKSYLRVSVKQNNELKGMFPSDSVRLRTGGYRVLETSAITPDTARIDTIFLKDTNGEDFIFDLNNSGSAYETDLSNSIDVKVELLQPAYKKGNQYYQKNNNHYAHRFLLDQIMLVPVDDKKIVSTVYWSNFANIVEMEPTTLPGDINGDDKVNVGDVTTIVSMILDPSAATDDADITGDGKVNVGDVTSLVSIILGTSNNAPARAAATRSADAPVVSASFDEDNTMYINVSNPDYPFTAIQFDLTIEGGISIVNDGEYYDVFLGSRTSSRNHSQPECAVQPDGSLRVVILSLKNKLFEGTEGDVATVSLDLTGVADGEYKYTIKNIVLSDPNSVMEYPADVEGWTTVTDGVTGIDSIAADGENANEAIYDLSGRKVTNPVKGGIYIKGGKKIIM